jgi:hypothetical protein
MDLAIEVLKMGKPTVIVLINGGIIALDGLELSAPAIIEAFYPGFRGAEALYHAIFGFENKFGRLPVTIYPSSFTNESDFFSFDMTAAPGRTYR